MAAVVRCGEGREGLLVGGPGDEQMMDSFGVGDCEVEGVGVFCSSSRW